MRSAALILLGALAAALFMPSFAGASSGLHRTVVIAYGTNPTAHCPAGYTLTGGGVHPLDSGATITNSQPDHNGWTGTATWFNKVINQTVADTVNVYAICLRR